MQLSFGKKVLLVLSILLLGGLAFLAFAYTNIHQSNSSNTTPVVFSVPKGASTNVVADKLLENNLISSKFVFVAYAKLSGLSQKIQAGDYELNKSMSPAQILESLSSGKVTRNTKRFTVLEGWSNKQIAARLDELGLATEAQFYSALKDNYDFEFSSAAKKVQYEGYLFPDTYELDANLNAHDIVQRMLNNFESQITAQMRSDIEAKNLSLDQIIVMASIVEREVGRAGSVSLTPAVIEILKQERRKVASVFYNRLEIGMALQSDATVNYATGKSDRRAQYSDLDADSPYNTYANVGLPPGPISNPGIDAIMAAITPANTDYLYFLSNKEGTAYFGRTLEEHNSNREKYLD